jgi:putative transposase
MHFRQFPGFDEMVNLLDELDPPVRHRKYDNSTVLQVVHLVLKSGIAWRELSCLGYPHTTIYNRWRHWASTGIMTKVFERLLDTYIVSQHVSALQEMYIDTSMIKNGCGTDCVGKNPTDRGRLGTKLSVICNYDQVPLAVKFYPANIADCTTTVETVELIRHPVKQDGRRVAVLVGDKGYISHDTAALLKRRFKTRLLTPHRRNARNQPRMSKGDKELLRRRHCVENLFCRLDKFKRLLIRHDRGILSFEAMHNLAFSIIILGKMSKLKDWASRRTKTGTCLKP